MSNQTPAIRKTVANSPSGANTPAATSVPLRFVKVHGLGNDFILVDVREQLEPPWLTDPVHISRLCSRRLGIGADGILLIDDARDPTASASLRIYNADGTRPEMCGNGIRCVAHYLDETTSGTHRREGARALIIETDAGLRECILDGDENQRPRTIRVAMGAAKLPAEKADGVEISVAGTTLTGTIVSMGNPHFVAFPVLRNIPIADPPLASSPVDLQDALRALGPLITSHEYFPEGINVGFARVNPTGDDPMSLELWVWERGAGITQACGTGACAATVAAVLTKRIQLPDAPTTKLFTALPSVRVNVPGGRLDIALSSDYSSIWMSGPAQEVYRGVI